MEFIIGNTKKYFFLISRFSVTNRYNKTDNIQNITHEQELMHINDRKVRKYCR